MCPHIELTDVERLTLEELSRHHPFGDFRPRALGVLALSQGHRPRLIADILGVTSQTVYNWAKAWRTRGLMGLLNGHQGGRPAQLTVTLLDTAEAVARSEPCPLKDIARRVNEAHPDAPPFSLDRLAVGLKARGLSWKRTRLSLKKTLPGAIRGRSPEPDQRPGRGTCRQDRPVLPGRERFREHPECPAVLVAEGSPA
jgi:transposase